MNDGCPSLCRACDHRHLRPEESERQKTSWLHHQLEPWADRITPLRGATDEERLFYRDRVRLHGGIIDGRWRFGMIVRDELVPLESCPVQSRRVARTLAALTEGLPANRTLAFAFYVQSGAQATLVAKTATMTDRSWISALGKLLEETGLEGLWLHLNPSAGRRLFAKRGWELLWGIPRSRDGQGLLYGPTAFQQLLPRLHHLSLDEAETFLDPGPGDAVADLYCGNGAGLARWRRRGATACGVELGGEALENAAVNAPGTLLLRGTCEERIPQLEVFFGPHDETGRLAYVNPPRTGLEDAVTAWLLSARPRRIAYLSCSAGTLRRDLNRLEEAYDVASISPYDFFPRTRHVETLVLLSLRGTDPEEVSYARNA